MRYDHNTYPEVKRGGFNSKYPVSMQPCGKSPNQRIEIAYVSVEVCQA